MTRPSATEHDHFWEMLRIANSRGFAAQAVLCDGWYASLENLKPIRDMGWLWQIRLKHN
ncbi:MAG: transposase [Isosphaeraceae bacterium]